LPAILLRGYGATRPFFPRFPVNAAGGPVNGGNSGKIPAHHVPFTQ
jgi:hypothetical protein